MSQSTIVQQRLKLHNEIKDVPTCVKPISKSRQKKVVPTIVKQLIAIVQLPRQMTSFIKTQVELKLALQSIQDRCLGGLKENPCTYNYRVSRTDQHQDMYFFTLEQYDKETLSKQQICHLIEDLHDPQGPEALNLIDGRFKILEVYEQQHYLSNEELYDLEQLVKNYPYQCTIQNVCADNSVLSQRIFNQKFIDLMGITQEMMFDHLKETQALPTIFDIDGSLKNWCELAKHSLSNTQNFEFQLNTFEGQQFKCEVEQRQMFKRSSLNPEQIVFIEYRILKIDEFLEKALIRDERLFQNHAEYFNLKNSEKDFAEFKCKTKYVDAKHYRSHTPCGYRQMQQ